MAASGSMFKAAASAMASPARVNGNSNFSSKESVCKRGASRCGAPVTSTAKQLFSFIYRFTYLKILDLLITFATHLSVCTNSQCRGPFGGFTIEDVVIFVMIVSSCFKEFDYLPRESSTGNAGRAE